MIALIVDIVVAMIVVPTISVGLADPYVILIEITIVGIMVILEVFNAKNVAIDLVAFSLFVFNFCNSCIAFIPMGVAAFPKPNMFAVIFETIYPIAG